MRSFGVTALGVVLVSTSIAGAATGKFSEAQLEEIMAPIALYPDAVLSTMCIAATYPLEVVEADRWRDKNPSLQGAELEKALAAEDWDASVKSLASFPDVLDRMSNNLDWTKDLGDAFLDQRSELMAAAQRLRGKAYDAGTLKTTPQQTVVKDEEAIAIAPASPETVYVPTYSPATAYGSTYTAPATPSYPSFWATPGGTATAGVLGFGAGIATTALIGSLFDWDDDDVYVPPYYARGGAYGYGHGGNVYVDRNTTVNADVNRANVNRANVNRADVKASGQRWQHDGSHRRGVGYRDPATAERFKGGRERVAAKDRPERDAARGFERGAGPGRDGEGRPKLDREGGDRPKVDRPAKVDRPGGGEGPHKRPDAAAPAARPKPAERPSRDSGKAKGALADARGGREAVDASRRGAASRGVASRAGQGGQGGGAKFRERAGGHGGGKGRGALGGGGRGRGGGGGGGRGRGGGGGGGGGKGRGGGGRRR